MEKLSILFSWLNQNTYEKTFLHPYGRKAMKDKENAKT
jgi:hypothetical protein